MNQIKGLHHVTAITSSAEKIYEFFTYVLGMRLVKKTINQDDIRTYHLFFADDVGGPGTDMTFFDFPGSSKKVKGTNEISKTSFRVPNDQALLYWLKRFDKYNIKHSPIKTLLNKKVIEFYDFDDQEYMLVSDENNQGVASGIPWKKGPIPNEFAITGLGPIMLTVNELDIIEYALIDIMKFKKTLEENDYYLYEVGEGGNGASVIVKLDTYSDIGYQGYGAVHHVAFRVENEAALNHWIGNITDLRIPNSGMVNRFWFKSLYARIYPAILFEFATDGPGFVDDEESHETLGETLTLPPRFRSSREQIEKLVRHIDTKRSDKTFKKEYLWLVPPKV